MKDTAGHGSVSSKATGNLDYVNKAKPHNYLRGIKKRTDLKLNK